MEKINVAELLKDCPKGMELDCYLYNGLEFDHIDTDNENYPIVCRAKSSKGEYNKHTFTEYGWYSASYDYSKCVIFPKGKTTWEGFHRPFKEGDIIRVRDEYSDASFIYLAILKQIEGELIYSHCSYNYEGSEFSTDDFLFDIYSIRFATEEEKQKLFQAIKDNGYKWNVETKTLEKLPKFKVGDTISNGKASITINYIDNEYYCEIGRDFATKLPIKNQDEWDLISEKFPNKFNINTLIPFESRVLVRNDESQYWIPAFWGCKRADGYTTTFGWCKYCIPFEGNEHLLETTNDCNEYFKTWK